MSTLSRIRFTTTATSHSACPRGTRAATLLLCAMLAVGGCAPSGPVPIAYGDADCAHCSMRIVDRRYGAELVTRTGKVRQFDAVECLAAYYLQMRAAGGRDDAARAL